MKLLQTKQFLRDIKKAKKRGKDLTKIEKTVALLIENKPLPPRYQEHYLRGEWADWKECHIEPNWLLIYQINEQELILARTGSHSDLFG